MGYDVFYRKPGEELVSKMTAIEIIALAIVGIIIGFIVGYFIFLIIRYYTKKNALKKIKEQNLRFKNCELDSFKEVLEKDEQENQAREIEQSVIPDPNRNKQRKTRFGKAYR